MHYRLATPADLSTLAQMRWDFRAEDGEVPRESFEAFCERYEHVVGDEMREGRLVYWVAEDETVRNATGMPTLVAQMAVVRVLGIPRPARHADQWGYLTDCYTRPGFRGSHIGATLLQAVQQWSLSQDFELLVVAPSDAAEQFYRRAGFDAATTFRQCTLRAFDGEAPSPSVTS